MDRNNPFFKQVELLMAVLPQVSEQSCFALKGGTAINLFIRDLPRLSVDIDLAYLPVHERDPSLAAIDQALKEITASIETRLAAQVHPVVLRGTGKIFKLHISRGTVTIKIEVSPVLRGSVFESLTRTVSPRVEEYFGYAEGQILSFDDLYAGKLCAALDRQHPRDLFDVKLLLENEGISERLKQAFLVYLVGHNRPMVELLDPNLIDLQEYFQLDFSGMVFGEVTLEDLEETRKQLIYEIRRLLTREDKDFLLSVKRGEPDWDFLGFPHVRELPAVKWKLHNLSRMAKGKRLQAIEKLEAVLG
jgi:predicted nucleotidyltransferase component of viral defense system